MSKETIYMMIDESNYRNYSNKTKTDIKKSLERVRKQIERRENYEYF